jgi:hypothetical protein
MIMPLGIETNPLFECLSNIPKRKVPLEQMYVLLVHLANSRDGVDKKVAASLIRRFDVAR